jgi:hypothetical protein|tara:strand:+ start:434 stop:649 length:216 start_codon:yes stop_codon:yes gene_type:complete
MSDLIDITLTAAYRIGGQIKTIGSTAEVAECLADDLIARNKAHKTHKTKTKTKKTAKNEPTEANSNSDGGE